MRRRDFLGATAVLATGLSGCSSPAEGTEAPTPTPIGDTAACAPPDGALADALPDSTEYERQGDVTASDATHDDGVTRLAYALYRGPDGEEYYCGITEFESTAAANEGTVRTRAEGGHSTAVLGLVQFGEYVFFAAGPDRERVRDILATTSLGEACLDEAFLTLSGTATPEPL